MEEEKWKYLWYILETGLKTFAKRKEKENMENNKDSWSFGLNIYQEREALEIIHLGEKIMSSTGIS